MLNIAFIGNCQMLSLCFYLQQLLPSDDNNIAWLMYSDDFRRHLHDYSLKCKNKILDYNESIEFIKKSDIIIFQEISIQKSHFCNTKTLFELKKDSCKIIKLPSIYLECDNFNDSIIELQKRESMNDVTITVSDIFIKNRGCDLMLSKNHPTTFLFLEVLKKICVILEITFFSPEIEQQFLSNINYMGLP